MSSTAERVQGSGFRVQKAAAEDPGPVTGVQEAEAASAGITQPHFQVTSAAPSTQNSVPSTSQRHIPSPKAASTAVLLRAKSLEKSYRKGRLVVPVLKGVDFHVGSGEFVAIVGQSGCGKSTLLHLLGTLDAPDAGEIHFEGHRIDDLAPRGRDVLRNSYFGMIFQFYHLLPELSTLENVLAPIMIRYGVFSYWRHRSAHVERAKQLLEMVGLSHRLTHKPRELSGGEMQRAAIARALIATPKLLLADEPTGNLDQKTGGEILNLLRKLNQQQGLTVVMVTHDPAIARQADRTVRLVEGRVAA
jgi:lipoprotein-releasing system ATP-binding protein